jgi:hypothetical protein
MHKLIRYAALAGAFGLGACDLVVQNPNQPETDRVLASPRDAEALVGSYYRRWHIAMYGTLSNVWGMTTVQSFENYSSLGNNCLNARAGIPRAGNDNSVANGCNTEQHRLYFYHGEVARVATNVLKKFNEPGYLLQSIEETNRAKAFAEFLRGISQGYVALFYDSAAVVSTEMAGDDPGVMLGYQEVMDSALKFLDNAIVHANAATGTSIPGWIPLPAGQTMDMPAFIRLIRSYKARLRANVARTPTERAAVDWPAVIADAQNGITADHVNLTNSSTGPYNTWVAQLHTWGLWHQMPPFIIGMGDTTSAYATWIAQPLDARGSTGPFFMQTPDLRFPQGVDRTAQVADFAVTSCNASGAQCERYFVNRPGSQDQVAGLGWGQSNYDFVRYNAWRINGQNGPMPYMKKAEMDMLQAEGYIRAGNFAAAAPLINLTRTAGMVGGVATGGGLPPVTGTADGGLTMPTCVPRKPVNASNAGGGTVACGDLMEAMKWEKRLETIQSHFGAWFLDSRGWGDLPEGTPYHWAPPYQDLQARRLPIYSTGSGSTGGAMAGPSTYGW